MGIYNLIGKIYLYSYITLTGVISINYLIVVLSAHKTV